MLYLFLVAINTPEDATIKPIKSITVNCSFKKIQAINAVVAGIKKNTVTVLLAVLFFIKNINLRTNIIFNPSIVHTQRM